MTIITAISSGGTVFYGYNDGHTLGDSPLPGEGCPWIRLGNWALGVSGSTAIFNILSHYAPDFSEHQASAADIVFKMRSLFIEYGLGKRGSDDVEDHYGIWCILVNVNGEIWDVDEALAYSRIPEGTLWARGSGTDYALGAAFVLAEQNVAPEARIITAIDAAIAHDLFCGGKSQVRTLA